MDGFIKTPSVLKNLLIGIFAVFFLPVTIISLINTIIPGTFADYQKLESNLDWVFGVVGPLLAIWLLYDIFQPRVKTESWLRIGTFKFCSTHPSYVLYDVPVIGFALFFFWIGRSSRSEMPVFFLMLGIAVLIPLLRLFAWYVLGLKINDAETYDAYQPALWVFMIFLVIFGGAAAAAAIFS